MPVQQVYFSWFNTLRQLWPNERITRVRNMAWLMAGLWVAKSIHLSCVALHFMSDTLKVAHLIATVIT